MDRNDLRMLAGNIEALREEILKQEFPPDLRKSEPRFKIAEASKIIDTTPKVIRDIVKAGDAELTQLDNGIQAITLSEMYKVRVALQSKKRSKSYVKSRPPHAKKPFVIAVSNLKGGSAKSTTAVHLAQWLAMQSYRTCLIESDPQGSDASLFGMLPHEMSPESDYADFGVRIKDTLLPLYNGETDEIKPLQTYWKNLDLVPANIRLFDADFSLPYRQSVDEDFRFFDVLNSALDSVKDDYDIIVIDCPPSFSYITLNSIYAADGLVVPVPTSHLDILATGSFFDQLDVIMEAIESNLDVKKEFDFVLGLRTKVTGNEDGIRNSRRINMVFGDNTVTQPALISKMISYSADKNKTAYEIDANEISREAYDRCITSLDAIHREIELRILEAWDAQGQLEF